MCPMSSARKVAVALAGVTALLVVGLVVLGVFLGPADVPAPVSRHVWLIMMENRADTSIIGRKDAPYLNSLLARYGASTNYRALVPGSQPNYIALFPGGPQGVKGNAVVSLPARNIADQNGAAGRTGGVFAENVLPNCHAGSTATGGRVGTVNYARKHEHG